MKRSLKRGTGKALKHKSTTEKKSRLSRNGISQRANSFDVRLPVPRSLGEGGLDVLSRRSGTEADRCSPAQSPVQVLESAIATRRKSQTELSGLGKLLADKSARLAALEITGDLNNPVVLTELVQLQISTGLLPRRIAVKEECDANAEQTLTQATNHFIREHLGPRVRRLAARTRAIVEREFSSHFPDPAALLVAVAKSEQVRTIESLSWSATEQPHHGALAHAEGALNAWTAADKFETTHLHNAPGPGSAPASGAVGRALAAHPGARNGHTVR